MHTKKTRIIAEDVGAAKTKDEVEDALENLDGSDRDHVAVGLEQLDDRHPIVLGLHVSATGELVWNYLTVEASRALREALQKTEERAS